MTIHCVILFERLLLDSGSVINSTGGSQTFSHAKFRHPRKEGWCCVVGILP